MATRDMRHRDGKSERERKTDRHNLLRPYKCRKCVKYNALDPRIVNAYTSLANEQRLVVHMWRLCLNAKFFCCCLAMGRLCVVERLIIPTSPCAQCYTQKAHVPKEGSDYIVRIICNGYLFAHAFAQWA